MEQVFERLTIDSRQTDEYRLVADVVGLQVLGLGAVNDHCIPLIETETDHQGVRLGGLVRSHTHEELAPELKRGHTPRGALCYVRQFRGDLADVFEGEAGRPSRHDSILRW